MLVTKLSTSFQQICQDRLFSGSPYMTLSNFGAIRCASENAIHISAEVIEFGTVGIGFCVKSDFESTVCNPPTNSREVISTQDPPQAQPLRARDDLELTCSTKANPDPTSVTCFTEAVKHYIIKKRGTLNYF